MPPEEDRTAKDWSQMLSFGGLAAAVVGVLLLAAALRTEGPPATPQTTPRIQGAALSLPVDPAPETAPTETVRALPSSGDLAGRAAADLERLARRPDGWTAQLAVLCDAERVARLTERFGEDENFYLLPVLHRQDPCFRICWNHYGSRDAAASADDMPPAMRQIEPRPLPKSIAEVIQ